MTRENTEQMARQIVGFVQAFSHKTELCITVVKEILDSQGDVEFKEQQTIDAPVLRPIINKAVASRIKAAKRSRKRNSSKMIAKAINEEVGKIREGSRINLGVIQHRIANKMLGRRHPHLTSRENKYLKYLLAKKGIVIAQRRKMKSKRDYTSSRERMRWIAKTGAQLMREIPGRLSRSEAWIEAAAMWRQRKDADMEGQYET